MRQKNISTEEVKTVKIPIISEQVTRPTAYIVNMLPTNVMRRGMGGERLMKRSSAMAPAAAS